MRILAIGDNCIDHYTELGKRFPGGNALNVAVYARNYPDIDSDYVGIVGTDDYGDYMLSQIKSIGMSTDHIIVEEGLTAVTKILIRDGDRIFDDYTEYREPYPPVNIWSNSNEVIVSAEIPGINPEDLDISVIRNQLTIEGERKEDSPEGDIVYHRKERVPGKFVRSFRLPVDVDPDKVRANYTNGILTVKLPVTESSKPKKIAIKTE